VIPPLKTKPFRTVLKWQVIATAAVAAVAGAMAGANGALSAMLGGVINVAAGLVYGCLLGWGLGAKAIPDAGSALGAMFRAEGGKVLVIVGGLWLALSTYRDLVPGAFFTAFVITVVVFSLAFFVRD
jgi:F0F1-type ATP synthase assembly protein I